MSTRWTAGLGAVVIGACLGCSAGPTGAASPGAAEPGGAAGPGRQKPPIEVAPITVSPYDERELEAEFERGRAQLLAERWREAADLFDKLVRLAPDGKTAGPSLYNAGIAHEALGAREVAIQRFLAQAERFPDMPTTRMALLRTGRMLAYLERWKELVDVSARIAKRDDLSVLDQIEARGLRGLALVELDRVDEANKSVLEARDLAEQHRLGESGRPPIETAAMSFALGEIRRKKSERITFDPFPPNFVDVLEERCQGLLDAQSAYMEAMRAMDAHWSAMAGYRVGQLYHQLHRDVMRIAVPSKADTLKKKQLFEGAMRLRYRVLLDKGLKMMEATVRLGERTGESSAWIARARDAKLELERELEAEKLAMSKLPFTEKELQDALDALKKK